MVRTRDHAGGENMVPEPLINSTQRRKLGDITNLQNQNNLVNQGAKQQQEAILVSSKENVEYLQKEHVMQVILERDGMKSELKKLRIHFQKVKEQNWLLAQENTRILAELNTSKDRLKVLQHELGCNNGLSMVRKIMLKEKSRPYTDYVSKIKPNDADEEIVSASESSNANSLQIKEKANNKRRVSGRTNKELASDGNNAADKKEFFLNAEGDINDNVQSKRFINDNVQSKRFINDNVQRKRYCEGREAASCKNIETDQSENMQKVVDAKEIEEDARFPLRRRSARLKSQEPEPSENVHESIETERRRRSTMFNNQELGFFQNLNGLHDDQEIAAKAGFVQAECSASRQSIGSRPEAGDTKEITRKSRVSLRRQSSRFNFQELGLTENLNDLHDDQAITEKSGCSASEQFTASKSEAVEPHDMTETTEESRDSSIIQSANVKTPSAIKEIADPPVHYDIVDESAPVSYTESKNKRTGDESEEMIKTSIGRRSRQAAEKIKSYKEPSLKEKMRRDF